MRFFVAHFSLDLGGKSHYLRAQTDLLRGALDLYRRTNSFLAPTSNLLSPLFFFSSWEGEERPEEYAGLFDDPFFRILFLAPLVGVRLL